MISYKIERLKEKEGFLTRQDFVGMYRKLLFGEDIEVNKGLLFDKIECINFLTAVLNKIEEGPIILTNNTEFIALSNSVIRSKKEKRVLVIDNHNFFHRTFHSVPVMTDSQGRHTAVLKSLTGLIKWLINTQERYTHIIFSSEGGNLKRKASTAGTDKEYKGNRSATDPILKEQIKLCESVLEDIGFSVLRRHGYEADDILASIAKYCASKNIPVTAFTTDKDANQLFIYEGFEIMDPKSKEIYKKDMVLEKFGVEAENFIDYQAIVGDTADNIPGMKGFGKVAAVELISKYHTLDNIYDNIENLYIEENMTKAKLKTAEKKQSRILEEKENAYRSQELCTLNINLFDDYPIDPVFFAPMPFKNIEKLFKSRFEAYDINY